MSITTIDTLPNMLPGWIEPFYLKRNGKQFGPYFCRCWKVNGKRRRVYVRGEDLARITAACERYRRRRQRQIAVSKWTNVVTANLSFLSTAEKRISKRCASWI